MKIHVISVGKPSKNFVNIINFYKDKCSKYHKILLHHTKDVKIKDKQKKIQKEEESILNIVKNGLLCALDEKGVNFDTPAFSKFINKKINAARDIYFIIGGAYGLSEHIKNNADIKIRLSDMVMQHDIALTVLLEQIYRSLTILKGIPYHK